MGSSSSRSKRKNDDVTDAAVQPHKVPAAAVKGPPTAMPTALPKLQKPATPVTTPKPVQDAARPEDTTTTNRGSIHAFKKKVLALQASQVSASVAHGKDTGEDMDEKKFDAPATEELEELDAVGELKDARPSSAKVKAYVA